MVYATPDDLVDYVDPVPEDAELLIRRASRLVDQALICARYDVDEQGLPADPDIAEALTEATCEQVAAWAESGESGTGAAAEYEHVGIGSVTLTRKTGGKDNPGSAATRLCPQALLVLRQAGLTGQAPRSG